MHTHPPTIPAALWPLCAALLRLPQLHIIGVAKQPAADPQQSGWQVAFDLPDDAQGLAMAELVATLVSRSARQQPGLRFAALRHPLPYLRRWLIEGTGPQADPDPLARLLLEHLPLATEPPVNPAWHDLAAVTNLVSRARNSVGSLRFRLDAQHHPRLADIYDRLARAEGLLESLRADIPYRLPGDDPDRAA